MTFNIFSFALHVFTKTPPEISNLRITLSSFPNAACAKINGCATTETCTSATNSQCAKCKPGYILSNGEKDTCSKLSE